MIRFLHTGDWQLGMTRRFFSAGAQERFTQSRCDAIRELGLIAKREDCKFMVVCGDVFESNQVERRTISRALDVMKDVAVPMYLLPGNHDPLNSQSVFRRPTFRKQKPPHVHVLENTSPINVCPGVEIVGAPWTSKRPQKDLVAAAIETIEPAIGKLRVFVAHGAVDTFSPDPDNPALISLSAAENAIAHNKIHYLALGDRHSLTEVGGSGRIWYAGAPEPTDFNEVKPSFALVVAINEDGDVATKGVRVGKWKFIEPKQTHLNTQEDIECLRAWFEDRKDKERSVVKLRFIGALSLSLRGELDELISHFRDLTAAIEVNFDDLIVEPTDSDFANLGFSGFASNAVERLRANINEREENEATAARDALALLIRLAARKP